MTSEQGNTGIEEGIPIPPPRGAECSLMDDVRSLKVGQSIVRPAHKRNSYYISAKRAGIRIVTRELGDGNMRVWRVEEQQR